MMTLTELVFAREWRRPAKEPDIPLIMLCRLCRASARGASATRQSFQKGMLVAGPRHAKPDCATSSDSESMMPKFL